MFYNISKALLTFKPYCVVNNSSGLLASTIRDFINSNSVDVIIFEQLVMAQFHTCINTHPVVLFPVDAQSRQKWQIYAQEKNFIKKLLCYLDFLMVKHYESQIYNKFESILLITEEDLDYTRMTHKSLEVNINSLSSGVDIEYFHPNHKEWHINNPSLIFLGNLSTIVNEQAILWFYNEVWLELKEECDHLEWFIVGASPGKRIASLSRDKNITITGYVDDYRSYIWNATVFISPLVIGTGIKNKILQAMAMGKAIVATSLSMEGISFENEKHVMLANGKRSFKDAVLLLLKDKRKRDFLSLNARRFVEKEHSMEKIVQNYLKFITSIIHQSK